MSSVSLKDGWGVGSGVVSWVSSKDGCGVGSGVVSSVSLKDGWGVGSGVVSSVSFNGSGVSSGVVSCVISKVDGSCVPSWVDGPGFFLAVVVVKFSIMRINQFWFIEIWNKLITVIVIYCSCGFEIKN
jgi:hypothetical protein